MKKLFALLFGKKKRYNSREVAAADALAMHIMNADRGATARIKKVRT